MDLQNEILTKGVMATEKEISFKQNLYFWLFISLLTITVLTTGICLNALQEASGNKFQSEQKSLIIISQQSTINDLQYNLLNLSKNGK